ncbi:MAG: SsrA-binding protein SmpB [Clostridiales bacterium]|nr:SsrA-binding protein SmpB [Clostridiales bacterium]
MDRKKKVMVQNRRARHEYFIEETMEAGMALYGTEVKSIRQGKANLNDAFIRVKNGEAFVVGMHISPYEQGNIFNRDPLRDKKLLLHKREIAKLSESNMKEGYTLIPLSIYFYGNYAKMEVGICKGKKLYDKRQALKEKDDRREMDRAMAGRNRS